MMATPLPPPTRSNTAFPKRMYLVFEYPRVSDGGFEECEHELLHWSRHSKILVWNALEQLGGFLASYTGWPEPVAITQRYAIRTLPTGYTLLAQFDGDADEPTYHITGHPSGKCFSDLATFAQHLVWLFRIESLDGENTNDSSYCDCGVCAQESDQCNYVGASDKKPNGPKFPVPVDMPLYHPLRKPKGVDTFFGMLGPVLPIYDNDSMRSGSIKPVARASAMRTNGMNSSSLGLSTSSYGAPVATNGFNMNGPLIANGMPAAVFQQGQMPQAAYGMVPIQSSPYPMQPMLGDPTGYMPHGMLPSTSGLDGMAAMQQFAMQHQQAVQQHQAKQRKQAQTSFNHFMRAHKLVEQNAIAYRRPMHRQPAYSEQPNNQYGSEEFESEDSETETNPHTDAEGEDADMAEE